MPETSLYAPGKKRIAAYCRVSTNNNNQDDSLESQKQYFLNEVKRHPEWELAGIYADLAKTGTQIKGRTDFQRMMRHAEEHKFDYIITKSISRFSRNVADTLRCLEKLHDLGIGVYFLEQGYDTEEQGSQIILTMLASVAEYESKSIGESIQMTVDAMNQKGTPIRKCSYGYQKKGTGWAIVPKEAVRVKLGFLMAANGYSFKEIADRLNKFEELDKTRRSWDYQMVRNMFENEVYVGDILTTKHVQIETEERCRKLVENKGIKDQYYISAHHDALVGRELFDKIRKMLFNKQLAGQEKFKGVQKVQEIAKNDHLLDSVRRFLPKEKGKWMKKLEEKNGRKK